MSIKRVSILLVALAAFGVTFASGQSGLQIRSTRPDATVTMERDLGEGKARVTVVDSKKEPVTGLTANDFAVERGGVTGKVLSVESIDRTVEAPRHTVLVLDNSYSMEERKAPKRVLADVNAVLKTVRPTDDTQLVVLRDGKTVKMGGRNLHVEVLKSARPSELQDLAARAYQEKSITDNTYLYEEMFAGIEVLKAAPAGGPHCIWVFSDGEDLNSAFKSDVVSQAAQGLENLCVFAFDYMPGDKMDPFLSTFASQNHGQARKGGKGADIIALFEKTGSRKEQAYIVNYEFPSAPVSVAEAPSPAPAPRGKPMVFQAAVLFDFDKSEIKPAGKEQLKAYREKVRAEMSQASKVVITGHTDSIGTEEYNKKLSMRRAQAVRDYLVSLGVDPAKLEVAGAGETKPVADNKTAAGRAKNRRVEIEVIGEGK